VLPDGDDFRVVLNDEPLPKLRISHAYKDMLTQAGSDPEVRDYLREKMRAGKFLMRCLDQREHTIKQIAEDIVRRQKQFFREGRSQLKPMTMAQVAEVVGVHETTVSRAVAGKFMETPQGLIEMRALFTSGVATSDGGAVASTGVKELIGTMVQDEDPSAPLTDDQIEALLKAKGIKIARRTVAKYRNEMKILPVAMRRNHRHS
jgi:RNA polymerase sigma-54 factor